MLISVQPQAFDPGAQLNAFTARAGGAGAVVSFTGIVRDENSRLTAMEIEHYPEMTEAALHEIAQKALARWALQDVLIIHRFGLLQVSEPIMMVATASAHRHASFEAASFLMDFLKSRAPFWKKEISPQGSSWVAAKEADEDILSRWDRI